MLILIGTGVCFDLTLNGIETLKKSDEVYIETYTNPITEAKIISLEKHVNKKINRLARKDVESSFLVKRAKTAEVVLLVSGDPLIATTHLSLVLDAKQAGITVKIIHNSSIYTATAAKSGLQIYKFGRTCSIPHPRPNYAPISWFGIIKENLERNCHTLVLLDTEPPMSAREALALLEKTDKDKLLEGKKIIVLSNVGENNEKITYEEIKRLKNADLGEAPFALIVPGRLHMAENEYLDTIKTS